MMTIREMQDDYVNVVLHDKVSREDYSNILPQLEGRIASRSNVRLLLELDDFRGWEALALPQELKMDFKFRKSFSRIAVVGESRLEAYVTRLAAIFISGEVRFFERNQLQMAREWIGAPPTPSQRVAAEHTAP